MGGSKWVTPLQKWDLSPLAQDMVDSWNGPSSPGQPSPATRSTLTSLGWLGVLWGNSEGWKPLNLGGPEWVTPLQKWDLSPLPQDMVHSWNAANMFLSLRLSILPRILSKDALIRRMDMRLMLSRKLCRLSYSNNSKKNLLFIISLYVS